MNNIKLSNNINIVFLDNVFFTKLMPNSNLIVLINKFGLCYDLYNKIYGLQHLLEHSFYKKKKFFNIITNAATSIDSMFIHFFVDKQNINLVKDFIISNDYFVGSSKITEEKIKNIILELENEYMIRKDNFMSDFIFLSNNDCIYGGGNILTLRNKESEIKKYIESDKKINTKNITVFLNKDLNKDLKKVIINVFDKIKKKEENLVVKKEFLDYNNFLKLNEKIYKILFYIEFNEDNEKFLKKIIFYSNILFSSFINVYCLDTLGLINVSFIFGNYSHFIVFLNLITKTKINLNDFEFFFSFNDIENVFFEITNFILYPELYNYYNIFKNYDLNTFLNKNKKLFEDFLKIINKKILNKQFYLVLPNDKIIYNKKTLVTKEKYFSTEISDDFFKNITNSFNKTFIFYNNFNKNKIINTFDCYNNIHVLEKNFNIKKCDDYLRLSFNIIFYLFNTRFDNFYKYLNSKYYDNNVFSYFDNNYKFKFEKEIYKIKSFYDFFIFIFYNKKTDKFLLKNIMNHIKNKGYIYVYDIFNVDFYNPHMIFLISLSLPDLTEKCINLIKNTLLGYDINKNYYSIIMSKKSDSIFCNFDELNKNISVKI